MEISKKLQKIKKGELKPLIKVLKGISKALDTATSHNSYYRYYDAQQVISEAKGMVEALIKVLNKS